MTYHDLLGQPLWTSREPGDMEAVETFDGQQNDMFGHPISDQHPWSQHQLGGVYFAPGDGSVYAATRCDPDVQILASGERCDGGSGP